MDGWRHEPLGKTCDLITEQIQPTQAESMRYVGLEHLDSGDPTLRRSGSSEDVRSAKTRFRAGDILYGKLRPYLDKAVVAPCVGICSTDILVFRPRDGIVEAGFLTAALHTREFVHHAVSTSTGVHHPRTSWGALKAHPLLIPEISEQRTIVTILRLVLRAKAASEQVIAAMRQLKVSLLNYLFSYGPVPFRNADGVVRQETRAGVIPSHWKCVPLRELADLLSGGTPSKAESGFWNGCIPWASPKDLKVSHLYDVVDHISEAGLAAGTRLVPAGAVLVVVRGMILSRDIPVAITMVPMAFNQDLKALLPREHLEKEYLLYALSQFRQALYREVGTSAHGTRRLSTSALAELALPLPPISEQRLIALQLSAVDAKLAAQEIHRSALDNLFKSLLHHLMTGKVRVNHLVDRLVPEAAG